MKKHTILFFFIAQLLCCNINAQITATGAPISLVSHNLNPIIPVIHVAPPDPDLVEQEDNFIENNGWPKRFARHVEVNIDPLTHGSWEKTKSGPYVWRLTLNMKDAKGLSLFFENFKLPLGSQLFFYNQETSQILGAYGSFNNRESGLFATDILRGESFTLELNVPENAGPADYFVISEIAYVYRDYGIGSPEQENASDFCEVNINCSPEGDDFQQVKKGIVRIRVKVGGSSFWCTGSLVNNTKLNLEPLVLTADHCAYQLGNYATKADLENWLFYFNYESEQCDTDIIDPETFTLGGAVKVAQGGNRGYNGSDFYLIRLIDEIPPDKPVYFNGWSAENIAESAGVTIHHPEGDVKKISIFNTTLITSSWLNNGLPSHWKVIWAETPNGWGVTEGGSSGSPLIDMEGRIIGTLTGGLASCTNTNAPDYYGKFAYHWESNGDQDTSQLRPWLDPLNLGILSLKGTTTGVPNFSELNNPGVKIYPNPATNYIMCDFSNFNPQNARIGLMDISGSWSRTFCIKNPVKAEIPVYGLRPGFYIVTIIADERVYYEKLTIR